MTTHDSASQHTTTHHDNTSKHTKIYHNTRKNAIKHVNIPHHTTTNHKTTQHMTTNETTVHRNATFRIHRGGVVMKKNHLNLLPSSVCTSYQIRPANMHYRAKKGKNAFANPETPIPIGRCLVLDFTYIL